MKTNKTLILYSVLLLVAILISSCGTSTGFVPAPPPVDSKNVMNIQQLKIQDSAQLMRITSPTIGVEYTENGQDEGKTATEIITLPDGSKGTMLSVVWGSWDKAELTLVNYYDNAGELVGGLIEARFEKMSLFQLFTGNSHYTLDRSSVTLVYDRSELGSLKLRQVQYAEKWGPAKRELAFGGYAVWTSRFDKLLPANYVDWGFWERNGTPANQVKDMIQAAMSAASNGVVPEFKAIDEDSGREVIGRQTGLQLYKDGTLYGYVNFEYKNTWGRQPNTPLIGSGALSMISWNFPGQQYYLVVLSPKISPVGSSLYIFTTSSDTAGILDTRANADNPEMLYEPLRNSEYPGVFLVMYGIGDIGAMTESTGDGTVYLGDSGGVQWRTVGDASYDNIILARNLLAVLGPAQYQNGLYYAYKPGSGSGMSYYLAALSLMYAPKETVFTHYGQDVGVLDRVLIPDLSFMPLAP